MPMCMPFTPSLPTPMRLCEVAITVAGRSTTRRAGESTMLSPGFNSPRPVISTLMPSALCSTSTFCSVACLAVPVFCVSAAAIRTRTSSGKKTLSSCFRISLLPTFKFALNQPDSTGRDVPITLNGRGSNFLGHFPGKRLSQLVLNRFFEDD